MGGTLAKYGAEACVRLVVLTDGGLGKDARIQKNLPHPTLASLSDVRRQELIASARHLGVHEVAWLGWTENFGADAPRLRCALRKQIRSFDPHVVITLNEAGITRHSDHGWAALATYLAVLDAAQISMSSLERFYTVTLPEAPTRFDYWGEIDLEDHCRVTIQVDEHAAQRLAACHSHSSQSHWAEYLQSINLLEPEQEIFAARWSRGNIPVHNSGLFCTPKGNIDSACIVDMPMVDINKYLSDDINLKDEIMARDKYMKENSVKGVIMASGYGTRMKNADLPKSLEKIAGRPILQFIVEAFSDSDVDDSPLVVIGPLGEMIRQSFPDLDFADQPVPMGTGHAVQQARAKLLESGIRHACVVCGDMPLISAASIEKLVRAHLLEQSVLTMATIEVGDFDGINSHYRHHGRILRDARGQICEIIEFVDAEPYQQEIKELNPGIYCFDTRWLWPSLEEL